LKSYSTHLKDDKSEVGISNQTLRAYDDLKSFLSAARYPSLSDAAHHLDLTKGALSHQIKRLEMDLGFRVFERSSKGISLTPKGRELLESAHHAFG